MEEKTEACFQSEICIGSSEVPSTWVAVCPKCNRRFRLLWPFGILHIPLHRVVDLRCPFYRDSFSLVAISLMAWDGSERLAAGLVEGLG
jgi:hypothetical protein